MAYISLCASLAVSFYLNQGPKLTYNTAFCSLTSFVSIVIGAGVSEVGSS
jgi:hypothetical protein